MNDSNAPATKQDLQDLKQELTQELRQEFRQGLQGTKDELKEFVRGIETSLLTAFHGYARGQQARMHAVETEDDAIKIRMAALEERVLALEGRIRVVNELRPRHEGNPSYPKRRS